MSTIAILSDIHSNLIALKAVLRDVKESGARQIIFLGDVVGYGSHPAECVEWVRKLGGHCVMGNHDAAMKMCRTPGFRFDQPDWREDDYAAGLVHSSKQLSDEQASWLAGMPYCIEIPGAVVAHASLNDMNFFNYIEDDKSARPSLDILARNSDKVGFFGHTQRQEVFPDSGDGLEWLDENRFRIQEGMPCVVMVGSVGQNRDETDRRACWTLWEPTTLTAEFRKVEYDRVEAARQIVAAGLPIHAARRLLTPEEQVPSVL
jgi:diadenosine tetraphosphatase ApaH/serine/threonine PP2A family protein phosphatase